MDPDWFDANADPDLLVEIARGTMPFGRYAGQPLLDVPTPYLLWLEERGWPGGRLGELLQTTLEIQTHGLQGLVRPLGNPEEWAARERRRARTEPNDGAG